MPAARVTAKQHGGRVARVRRDARADRGRAHVDLEEEIPVLSRILAIVDAFDAMTNERIYSKPKSPETAAEEILRCAGTQFDPTIARVFVEQVLGL